MYSCPQPSSKTRADGGGFWACRAESPGREDLTRIFGIGEECAERIIQYRERHGRIRSVEELTDELKGFGDHAMRDLRENATA